MTIALPLFKPTHPTTAGLLKAVPPRAPALAHAAGALLDSHGRTIHDLRLSITDRCNFRCVYCMDTDVKFFTPDKLLTREQMQRLVRICAGLGIRKVRLTGGEPTLHPQLEGIIADMASIGGVEVALTTNGSMLELGSLQRWRAAGLTRITISIDAVDAGRFAALTRSNCGPERVVEGVQAAIEAGLQPVKLNAVIIRGVNEDQIVGLAGLARRLGVVMRFIEFMPLDSSRSWDRGRVVNADEVVRVINAVYPLRMLGRDDPTSTSELYAFADGSSGSIGIIAPVSRPFCGACSRLRVTADGKIRPCLFSNQEWDVGAILRSSVDDREIAAYLVDSTWTKQAGHGISAADFAQPERTMSAIGG